MIIGVFISKKKKKQRKLVKFFQNTNWSTMASKGWITEPLAGSLYRVTQGVSDHKKES